MKSKALLVLLLGTILAGCSDPAGHIDNSESHGDLKGTTKYGRVVNTLVDTETGCQYFLIEGVMNNGSLTSMPRISEDGKTVRGCKNATPSP